jgi:hypothetical protein
MIAGSPGPLGWRAPTFQPGLDLLIDEGIDTR